MAAGKLAGRGNAPVQIAMMQQMQTTYGNRAVQRFMRQAAAPPPAVQRAEEEKENSYHRVAGDITGLFEGGKADTLNLIDKGIISYGKHQATLSGGALYSILLRYTELSKGDNAKKMADYLDRVKKKDETLRDDAAFIKLLKDAAHDTEMEAAQEEVFSKEYWNPAKKAAAGAGVKSALGHALLYDTHIHGGMESVLSRTEARLGGKVGATVGGKTITEQEFLSVFAEERQKRLNEIVERQKKEAEKLTKEADELDEQAAAEGVTPEDAKKLKDKAAAKRKEAKKTSTNASMLDTAANKTRVPSYQAWIKAGDLDLRGDDKGQLSFTGLKSKVTGLKAGATIDNAADAEAGATTATPATATPATDTAAPTGEKPAKSEWSVWGKLSGWGKSILDTASGVGTWAMSLFSWKSTDKGKAEANAAPQLEAGDAAMAKAIAAGMQDSGKLADLVFHARHPELGGKALTSSQKDLIQEWKAIHDTEVKPALAKAKEVVKPAAAAGTTAPATTPATTPTTPTTSTTPTAGTESESINVVFGSEASQSAVTDYSLGVLKDILKASGQTSATITSTARNANDQVRAMYNNLVGTGPGKGVAAQRELYGAGGEKVIDVFEASLKAEKKPEEIKADMEAKVIELGPSNVSRHCGDPATLNVFDVGPNSIGKGKDDTEAQEAFVAAGKAEEGKRVSKFIPFPGDPGHHFEIVPK